MLIHFVIQALNTMLVNLRQEAKWNWTSNSRLQLSPATLQTTITLHLPRPLPGPSPTCPKVLYTYDRLHIGLIFF